MRLMPLHKLEEPVHQQGELVSCQCLFKVFFNREIIMPVLFKHG